MTYEEFKSSFHIQLNPQQEAAVRQVDGPTLLLAVPGSGKTTVLVTRLGYMLYCLGIDPGHILTVTYTVAAAGDMKRRFHSFFGAEYAEALPFRTINGVCQSIIHRYARVKGTVPFELESSESRLSALVRELMAAGGDYPTDQDVKEVRTRITYCKNMLLTDEEVREIRLDGVDFPAVYFAYRQQLERSRRMDYDDQMVFACRILRRFPDLLAYYQTRFPYLCVDEAQDTSKIQHKILRLLAARSRNLFLVGDEDQSIYGFRAAWPQALLEFQTVYPEARVLLMETNYRSTRSIVAKADAFIQRNQSRHAKHMTTDNPQGEPIRVVELEDYSRQYRYLLRLARECSRSTAILYRNNDSALPLIDLLEREGVPYRCRQRESYFFSSPVVRDLTDMLRFALDGRDAERFLRFYYKLDLRLKRRVLQDVLARYGGDAPVLDVLLDSGQIEPWQAGRLRALRTHFSKLPALGGFAALQRIVKYMGYGDYLSARHADAARVNILLSLARQSSGIQGLLDRLDALQRVVEGPERYPDCPLVLSTIHSSKGLEYDRVVLIDVMDGVFPAVDAPEEEGSLSPEEREALEEERRLFYVGITRAKYQLELLTYSARFGEPAPGSTFARQLLGSVPSGDRAVPRPKPLPPPRKAPPPASSVALWEKDYIPGAAVVHRQFGRGILLDKTGSIASVSFREHGTKKLDLTACLRKGLIRPEHPV